MEHNFIQYFSRLYHTFKRLGDTEKVVSWKSKGLSAKNLNTPATTGNSLPPSIKWYENSNICLTFKESCLKQKRCAFTPQNICKYKYIYKLNTWSLDLNSDFIIKDCLCGGVKLAKMIQRNLFELRSEYSLADGRVGKNVINFGVDMSSSVHIDNNKKDILILDKGSTQGLDDTTLSSEAQYSINF